MARKITKKPGSSASAGKSSVGKPRLRAEIPTGSAGNPSVPVKESPAALPPDSPAVRAELALIKRQSEEKWIGPERPTKLRKTVAAIIALKVQGCSNNEIAEQLNLKPKSISQYMWIAGKKGWLNTADPHTYAEHALVHRVVDNLHDLLHARNMVTGLPDKEVTLEAAKGFGVFKDHSKTEQAPVAPGVLAIQVVLPTGDLPKVRAGAISSTPNYVEGSVVPESE